MFAKFYENVATDKKKSGLRDGQTDGQHENSIPPPPQTQFAGRVQQRENNYFLVENRGEKNIFQKSKKNEKRTISNAYQIPPAGQ